MVRDRSQRRTRRTVGQFKQLAPRQIRNPFPPIEILSADQIEAIHNAAMTILEEIGMDFLNAEAREIFRKAGGTVSAGSERVRLDRGLVMEALAHAPSRFTFHARNPANSLEIGGNATAFCMVASTPNASDMDGGRRPGNFVDFENFLRLSQILNICHLNGGYPVEPVDVPPETRHLACIRSFLTLTDKPYHAYSLGRQRILDALEMTRIGRGLSSEQLLREPSVFSIINTSSPLRLDGPMIEGLIELARHNQIVCVTPFTLSGAMAPATLAGALAQQNAEGLASLALVQLVNPGAPVIYGGFTSNVDMKTGAPAFGTPEFTRAAFASGQLARRYNLPYRSSNVNASNAPDAQAAYESEMSVWGALMGGANFLMHGLGWIEGGLCASFEKVILDAEILQSMAETLQPIEVTEETLGLDAMREVGPGGHYFGAAHTLARYETAFYAPILSDWRNFETWAEDGSRTATDRANTIFKQLLTEYEPPAIDPAVAEELDAFVARRTAEGGAVAA